MLSAHDSQQQRMRARFAPVAEQHRYFGREPLGPGEPRALAVKSPEIAGAAVAKAHGPFEHRVEHRRELARRGIDDLQYLSRRGLLVQCLARLGQEPCIFHRNDGLCREVLDQRDLLLAKRPHFLAVDDHCAQQDVVLE